ncbi:MAG TPA: glycosyltransferase [Acidimicrobiales bacterium]|nr:glycosyltransferase [Acidimicrobiales bacterium]
MKVSVCIAATRPDTIGAALRSVVAQEYRDWEVVVVAQGPAGAAIAEVVERELAGRPYTVVAQDGRGVSRARNAAVAAAQGDAIAMLDDDCEADADWLEVLVDRFAAHPDAGLVGGALVAPPRSRRGPGNCPWCEPHEVVYRPRPGSEEPPGFTWLTSNVAFLRSTAEAVGPFDPLLGAGGRFPVAEDIDFRHRVAAKGITMVTTPKAVVRHTGGWRYGVQAVWRLQRAYNEGNGAYAAKLAMHGDPRGRKALADVRRLTALDWIERRRPRALPAGLWRYAHFMHGYRSCLRGYRVGPDGLLQPRPRGAGR